MAERADWGLRRGLPSCNPELGQAQAIFLELVGSRKLPESDVSSQWIGIP